MPASEKNVAVELYGNTVEEFKQKVPFNIEAEQYVLGCIINNNDYINRVADFLLAEHFYEPLHREIYEKITTLYDNGTVVTPITLKNYFIDNESMFDKGGNNYLLILSNKATGVVGLKSYAKIIYNTFVARRLIEIAEETIEISRDIKGDENASSQIEEPESKLFQLASSGNIDSGYTSISDSVRQTMETVQTALKSDGSLIGVPSKMTDIDNLLGGFNKSDLIILAARPSMGKTALALNFTTNAAEHFQKIYEQEMEKYNQAKDKTSVERPQKKTVGIFSLEMSCEQLTTRLLSMKSGINISNIRRGKFQNKNDDLDKLIRASDEVNKLPIIMDDTPALTISALRTRARRLKRKHNLSLLLVDYLQLLQGMSSKARENRVQEISEISMGLKAIAKELNIPVIALSQLSRQVEQRTDKRPQLADLRESGSIEQDADIVMFIYRESYYKEREQPADHETEKMQKWQEEMERIDNLCEIIIAKNRNGPINNVKLFFEKATTRFGNYSANYSQQE